MSYFVKLYSKLKVNISPYLLIFLIFYFLFFIGITFHYLDFIANDDAFITLRYAENISIGKGFVFNENEYVLGTTTPLFAFIVGLLGKIFSPMEVILVRTLQVTIILLSLAIYYIGIKTVAIYRGTIFLIVPFLLISDRAFLLSFGMETPIFIFFITLIFIVYINKLEILCGLFLALLIITRPEGILVAAILLGYSLRKKYFPKKGLIVFVVILGIWCLFSIYYFGSIIPNSVQAKVIQGYRTGHFDFVKQIFTHYFNWYLAPWLILSIFGLIFLLFSKAYIIFLLVAWVIICLVFYTIGSAPIYPWYYLPIFYVIYLLSAFTFCFLIDNIINYLNKLFPSKIKHIKLAENFITLLIISSISFVSIKTIKSEFSSDWYIKKPYPAGSIINKTILPYKTFGEWINQNTNSDVKVTCAEIGVLGYYSKRYIVDLAGLINPKVFPYLESGNYDWWIKPYKLPNILIVHIPIWRIEGIKEDFLRYFYRPIMFEGNKGLFILKSHPDEYDFEVEHKALKDASESALKNPTHKNFDNWINYANYLCDPNSLTSAYENAHKHFPKDRYYREGYVKKILKNKNKDYNQIAKIYETLLIDFPDAYEYLHGYSEAMLNQKNGQAALKYIDKYLKRISNDARAYALKSKVYRLTGEPKKAIESALITIKIEPDVFWHYRTIAIAYESDSQYKKAIEFWRMFIKKGEDKINMGPIIERIKILSSLQDDSISKDNLKLSDIKTSPELILDNEK